MMDSGRFRAESRFDEVRAVKIASISALVLFIAAAAALFFSIPSVGTSKRTMSETEKALVAELERLRTTWEHQRRQRILDAASGHAADYAGPLQRILRTPDHKHLVQAAEYAGALGARAHRTHLLDLVNTERRVLAKVRYHAVLSAEKLERFEVGAITDLLVENHTKQVRLAGLEILGQRAEGPWDLVVSLLADESLDEELRQAAAMALPKQLPPALQEELLDLLENGDGLAMGIAVTALHRTTLGTKAEGRLLTMMPGLEAGPKIACMELLGNRGEKLQDPDAIWRLAVDSQETIRVRARALYCLEQTRSFDSTAVKQAGLEAPMLRHFAARCLIADGREAGLQSLLELVETESTDASIASRRLLAWLTGRSPGTSRDDFRGGLSRAAETLKDRPLPAPSFDFGS
jgi:hypothetical protein